MVTTAVMQPSYLPWAGLFDQIDQADTFVLLNTVAYDREGWRNRNRVKGPSGQPIWLTVPALGVKGTRTPPPLSEVRIATTQPWERKHLQALRTCYGKAPYFDDYFPDLEAALLPDPPWELLADMTGTLTWVLMDMLKIETELVLASGLTAQGVGVGLRSTERLVAICQHLGATNYYCAAASRNYLDEGLFRAAEIRVSYQDDCWVHPVHTQRFGEFVSHLSVVDLLFNCGPDSLSVIRGGRRWAPAPDTAP